MRIKEFADYFNVKKTTVRYYTDINLLIPEKNDGYAEYNVQCIKDMDDIIRLKNMGFSIKEIQFLKVYERFNVNYSEDEITYLDQIFDNKICALKNEINKLSNQIEAVKDYKKNILNDYEENSLGVPLNALEMLSCPVCSGRFSIEGASIRHNMIFSGSLQCKCGKILSIEDGLILDGEYLNDVKNNRMRINSELTKKSMPQITNEHIVYIKTTGSWISNYLKQWNHTKGILIPNADSDLLIMKTEEIFKDDGIYFLCSYDLRSLMVLKSKMERLSLKGSFVFMYILEDYPIVRSIPYVIDNGGNICDMIKRKFPDYSLTRLKPFVNEHSMWVSIHVGLPSTNSSLKVTDERLEYLLINKYKEKFKEIGMKVFEEHEIGMYETIKGTGNLYSNIETLTLRFQMLKSL